MKLIEPNNYHVIDEPLDPMEIIRQKSTSDVVDDDPFYICNISDIIQKHRIWQQHMPRVLPFYGKFHEIFEMLFRHSLKIKFQVKIAHR